MSSEHKRPLLAFAAVFVVAMLVVVGAARSEALRHLMQERTVDIVAATTLDVVGEPEPPRVVAAPEGDVSGAEPVSSSSSDKVVKGTPLKDKAVKGKAGKDKAAKSDTSGAGKAKGHGHAKAPGKAKGHAHAKAPGNAKGHAHAQPPAQAQGHHHGATTGPAKAKGQAKGHGKARGHAKGKATGKAKGHAKRGH